MCRAYFGLELGEEIMWGLQRRITFKMSGEPDPPDPESLPMSEMGWLLWNCPQLESLELAHDVTQLGHFESELSYPARDGSLKLLIFDVEHLFVGLNKASVASQLEELVITGTRPWFWVPAPLAPRPLPKTLRSIIFHMLPFPANYDGHEDDDLNLQHVLRYFCVAATEELKLIAIPAQCLNVALSAPMPRLYQLILTDIDNSEAPLQMELWQCTPQLLSIGLKRRLHWTEGEQNQLFNFVRSANVHKMTLHMHDGDQVEAGSMAKTLLGNMLTLSLRVVIGGRPKDVGDLIASYDAL